VILGGVIRDYLLHQADEILLCSHENSGKMIASESLRCGIYRQAKSLPRPLLVGSSTIPLADGRIVVIGGGATCFSMGTFWNKGIYTFYLDDQVIKQPATAGWAHEKTIDIIPGEPAVPLHGGEAGKAQIKSIPRRMINTSKEFEKILSSGQPVVLERIYLGSCIQNWTLDYLANQVGSDRKVCCMAEYNAHQLIVQIGDHP